VLKKRGDVRGELADIQLALEDARGAACRALLLEEERLLRDHAEHLWGPLAKLGPQWPGLFLWRRGFLDSIASPSHNLVLTNGASSDHPSSLGSSDARVVGLVRRGTHAAVDTSRRCSGETAGMSGMGNPRGWMIMSPSSPPVRHVWNQPPHHSWPPYGHAPPAARPSPPDGSTLIITLVCVFCFVTPVLVAAARLLVELVMVETQSHRIELEVEGNARNVQYSLDADLIEVGSTDDDWSKRVDHRGSLQTVRLYASGADSCLIRVDGKVCSRRCDWASCQVGR